MIGKRLHRRVTIGMESKGMDSQPDDFPSITDNYQYYQFLLIISDHATSIRSCLINDQILIHDKLINAYL